MAEELHFTRAAERLYVSQPALSQQIRALERQLGAPLFTRGGGDVRLTPVGTALPPHARRVLAGWDAGRSAVAAALAEQRATLVIGMSTGPGRGGLRLRQVGWDDPTAGLADGSSDLAYVWLPLPEPARYGWLVVAEEQRFVALPDEPFLALPGDAGALREHWLAPEARGGRPARIGAVVSGPDETYEALVDGRGVVLLAEGNAPLLARDGVAVRPVDGLSPSRPAPAWRADDTRPLVRRYAEARRRVTAPRIA
ncbi:LysR family transcriptional regulator [Streptomyces sp. MS19]|uniref:LysR family transcriptional regulator n=1 Tax=Streptomyces sp. MS19 TaxID=3385972 RepID=UPI00399F7D98